MRSGAICALAEVKCRARRFDPYLISLHKYETLRRLSRISKLPGLIVVEWNNVGIFFTNIVAAEHDGIEWMEDSRNREQADAEPCVAINCARFSRVKIESWTRHK